MTKHSLCVGTAVVIATTAWAGRVIPKCKSFEKDGGCASKIVEKDGEKYKVYDNVLVYVSDPGEAVEMPTATLAYVLPLPGKLGSVVRGSGGYDSGVTIEKGEDATHRIAKTPGLTSSHSDVHVACPAGKGATARSEDGVELELIADPLDVIGRKGRALSTAYYVPGGAGGFDAWAVSGDLVDFQAE